MFSENVEQQFADEEDDFRIRFGTLIAKEIPKQVSDNPFTSSMRESTKEVDNLLESIQEGMGDLPYTMIYTGSQTDGLLCRSDVDVMYCMKHFIVVENEDQIPEGHTKGVLLMDTEGCYPCYTKLQLFRPHPDKELMTELFVTVEDGHGEGDGAVKKKKQFLLTEKFSDLAASYFKQTLLEAETTGPARKVEGESECGRPEIDYVPCLECPFWPKQARTDFPDFMEVRNTFTSCHLVPVSHKKSASPDIEFRISFSLAEKRFAQNWSDFQMTCFYFFKYIMKEYVFHGQMTPLSSYHIKTLFYWMIDAGCIFKVTDGVNQYGEIYQLLFTFINHFFTESVLKRKVSHFFIPSNNIIDSLDAEDFRTYMIALKHNFQWLPLRDELSHLWTTKDGEKDDIQELEDTIYCRVVEIEQILKKAWQLESMCYYMYAEHDIFTVAKLKQIVNTSSKCWPQNKDLQSAFVRCQATLQMYEALTDLEGEEREKSLSEVLHSYLSLIPFHGAESSEGGEIAQCGLVNVTHVALYYYLVGDHVKCKEYIAKALEVKVGCGEMHSFCCKEDVFLPAGNNPTFVPKFFDKEVLRYVFQINSIPFQPVVVDPIVLLSFLDYRVTGTQRFMEQSFDSSLRSLSKRSRFNSMVLLNLMFDRMVIKTTNFSSIPKENVSALLSRMLFYVGREMEALRQNPLGDKFEGQLMVTMRSNDESEFLHKLEIIRRLFGKDSSQQERLFELISSQYYNNT